MTDIVIAAAKRTPVGSFLGSFASTPAHELGRIAIQAALAQAGVSGDEIDEVILGTKLAKGDDTETLRAKLTARGLAVYAQELNLGYHQ